jgi:Pentapeptide repeats (8 copies)
MTPRDLLPLVRGYLDSAGFLILSEAKDYLVADRPLIGNDRETSIVWAVPSGTTNAAYESALRGSISSVRPKNRGARAYVLSWSRDGFTRDFLTDLVDEGIKLLVPIQYFDTAFKSEEAGKALSAIDDLRSLDVLKRRVPQPYSAETQEGETVDGADLYADLVGELGSSEKPSIHVIVGRAGIGKSILANAMFARLYDDFIKAKAALSLRPRPIPMLPVHLRKALALRTQLLIDEFLQTEIATRVPRETFEWLLVNGFSTWLLDGLDELYAGDPDFFDRVLEIVTRPGFRGQITICCRDSLLTTSDAFSEFRDYCRESANFKIYRLHEWDRSSKRHYAWLNLEGRLPTGDQDTPRVGDFLQRLDQSKALRELSGLPFYCQLLVEQFRDGELREFESDVKLLDFVIDRMLARERDKGLLDDRFFVPKGLQEWLEQIAMDYVGESRYAAVAPDDIEDYGRLVLRPGLAESEERHILLSLAQLPLFTAGSENRGVAFTHDLIAESLAARGYLGRLSVNTRSVADRLVLADLEQPTLLRFMASKLDEKAERAVIEELRRRRPEDREFAVLLMLLLLARPAADLIKQIGLEVETHNLAGVRFSRRDLAQIKLMNTDLSQATFENCDLRGARFEGALLSKTRFEGENQLEDAQFGDLRRVRSVFIGRRLVEELGPIREWIAKVTGRPPQVPESCSSAGQVRFLFEKFIRPLGEGRRDELRRSALTRGKRLAGAASPEECLAEAVRAGYLSGPDFRDRYFRPQGDLYAEMVNFVKDGRVSGGLGGLLSKLCKRKACTHQLFP